MHVVLVGLDKQPADKFHRLGLVSGCVTKLTD